MIKKNNGEEFFTNDIVMLRGKLISIHRSDSLPFRHIMHYVGHDEHIGAGVNLMLDFIFDLASGELEPRDEAQHLLQQLGYTIDEIQNVNKN